MSAPRQCDRQAPLWDWRDQVLCCICAPHAGIVASTDRRFLWRLARRKQAETRQVDRLNRIVEHLDRYARDIGIVWP